MKKNAGMLIGLGSLCLMASGGYAQTVYECKNAAGVVQFTDKPCHGLVRVVPPPKDAVSPERKAENDARIARDKALGNSSESSRLARDQAGYAAQDQQVQASKAIANTVEQERTQQSSTATSVLPAAGTVFTPPGQ